LRLMVAALSFRVAKLPRVDSHSPLLGPGVFIRYIANL
jgi:hypothetical protein